MRALRVKWGPTMYAVTRSAAIDFVTTRSRQPGEASKHRAVFEQDAVPAPGTLRINAIWGLPALLGEHGLNLADVLAAAGVRSDIFGHPDNLIEYVVLERLLLECERRLDCDYFTLILCQRSRLAEMGLAGSIALCAATAGEGLQDFMDHFNLHDTAATVSLVHSGDYVHFVYAISEPGMSDTRHFQVGGVTIAFNIMQDLCGRDWRPAEVTFASRSPSDLRPFQKFFRAPVHCDRDESALVFERRWLDRKLPPVDRAVRDTVMLRIREQRAAMLADFPATIRRILRKQLLLRRFSMSDVARMLSMHRRTLDRTLQRHGTNYRDLFASVRHDVARQLLLDTALPINEIAESLRYSSAANFTTAFRRWDGRTPAEFRRRAGT